MRLLKNLRISTVSWLFVIILMVSGAALITTSIVAVDSITAIRTIWGEFQAGRSEKARALNAVRKEIGYGGMIHQFKNYVLRQDAARVRLVNSKLGGVSWAIATYRAHGVNKLETQALDAIVDVLDRYGEALTEAQKLVAEGKSPVEIDKLIRIDDAPAIAALDALDLLVVNDIGIDTERLSKPQIVASLYKAMGYGGMIHDFKNLVLRHEHVILRRARGNLDAARKGIGLYMSHPLNQAEKQAILGIAGVVEAYSRAIVQVDRLSEAGTSVVDIDKAVRVDDAPALRGFETLSREVFIENEVKARRVDAALELIEQVATSTAWGTLAIIAGLMLGSLWIFRFRILGPIARTTNVMTNLADGNLDVQISDSDGNNEIGEMARAIQVFKENAQQRKLNVDAIRNRESRISAILENVIDGIITIDEVGIVESFNHAAEVIFGYDADEVITHNIKMLMPDPYHGEHDGYLSNYRDTGVKRIIGIGRQVVGLRKDGSTFPMELAVGEMQIDGRRMFTGIVRDITERIQTEQMKKEFVSTVSHELRTPLTSIKGSLGLIRAGAAGELPDKMKGMLNIAYSNSDRLIRLINDILDMEKIAAGKMDFIMLPMDLSDLLKQTVQANKGYGEDRNVRLAIVESVDNAMVEGDHDRLMQVMANLLSNAVKFSPDGDCVDISLVRRGGRFVVSVSDNGAGIPEEFKDLIFEKFCQADSSDTRKKGGTGLGLSISKAIVESHGGKIGFESTPGKGTRFYFEIAEWVARKRAVTDNSNNSLKILHVEDEPDVIEIISILVEGFADVVSAKTVAEAQPLIETQAFDLVILDLSLPDGTGEELLAQMKSGANVETPVIVFSAREIESDGDMVHMMLVKSRTTNETLLNAIKSALGI